jgi:hypothetical protein
MRSPDKAAARERAMKHFGLFKQDNQQKPAAVVHREGQPTVFFEPIPPRKGNFIDRLGGNDWAMFMDGNFVGSDARIDRGLMASRQRWRSSRRRPTRMWGARQSSTST